MQRYFFHLASKDQKFFDNKGRDMDSLYAAYQYALRLFQKSGAYFAPEEFEGWRMNIANEIGQVKLVVLFPKIDVIQNLDASRGAPQSLLLDDEGEAKSLR
jgi:Domain of unknown function (DUF6894)